ncbi:MAG: hypothetical protein R3C18_20905 [Planctomycetaceae bacterium]
MNCDEVFDLLTSPVENASPQLGEHLHQCPRCRDLQEAIAPALSVVRGASVSKTSVATRPAPVKAPEKDTFWRYIIAFSAGLTAALLLMAVVPRPGAAMTPTGNTAVCLWQAPHDTADNTNSNKVVLRCVSCHMGQ